MAVPLVFHFATTHLKNTQTDLLVDNQGAALALGATWPTNPHKIFDGSNCPSIQALVIAIHDLCTRFGIDLHAFWVPRE